MKNSITNTKLYGLFRRDRKTGAIEGYVEHSFSMGWSPNYVRAWRKLEDAEYYLNSFKNSEYGSNKKKYHYFIGRLNTRKFPIKFATEDIKLIRKFDWRNPRFFK